jgi:putative flippase GtrA
VVEARDLKAAAWGWPVRWPAPALLNRLYVESFKYFLVSALALAVDFGLLAFLTSVLKINYLIAAAVGFLAGLVINYLLSVTLVFQERRLRSRRLQFLFFLGIGLLGLVLTELSMALLVGGLGLGYAVAKVGAAGVSFTFNYVARRLLLFTGAGARA